jgi:hypothetical protein
VSDDKPKTTRLDPRPVSETPGLWPLKKVSRQELAELYPVVDEKPEPISGAEFVDGMPGMSERIEKLMRSLMRHRERYIRAWIAHYGARPEQVHIVTQFKDNGEVMRMEYRKDSDHVAELVKAAWAVVDVGFHTHECEHGPAIDALEAVLKPFEGKP